MRLRPAPSEEMSPLQVLTAVMVAGVLGVAPGAEAGRTTQPPHTLEEATHRMDMILNNTRSRENYIRCFMDKGICNKDALNIKRILTDALATNCSNCTQIQRMGVDKFFHYLQSHQPETWVSLTDKYKGGGANGGEKKRHHDDDDDDDDDEYEKSGKKHKKDDHHGSGGKNTTKMDAAAASVKNGTITTTDISILF